MALTKEEKTSTIEAYRRDEKDTGSVEVQVALINKKIKKLTVHMTENKHDYSSKRGLDILIARRKNLLAYLKRTDPEKYDALMAKTKADKAAK